MQGKQERGNNQNNGEKRGFSLPTTSSKPPMPQTKPPKKDSSTK